MIVRDIFQTLEQIESFSKELTRLVNSTTASYNLSYSVAKVILKIFEMNCVTTQGHLAKILNVQTSSLARKMDQLEKEGYILRVTDKSDRRSRVISLTDHGKSTAIQLAQTYSVLADRLMVTVAIPSHKNSSSRLFNIERKTNVFTF
ncbi:MarR family transcriptional regulator [Salmonella enterica subsp. enterica serovar Typhimurium]|nr:MarR family transcriptional regulator [Salmonella enterica subsp. enterica serovar Typhimurium]